MKFKSALVTQVSGSIGGMTGAHNQGGLYFRARSIPVNPSSTQQVAVRNALTDLVNRWTTVLTVGQRDVWETYATRVPKTNSLGDSINLSGQQWFIGANVPRLQAGLDPVDDGPTAFNRGAFDPTVAFAASTGGGIEITFDDTLDWADEDGSAMLTYMSRPVNPSVNFFNGPYRFLGSIEGDSVTPPTSPDTKSPQFILATGQKVFFAAAITRADGRLTSRFRFEAIVT